MCEEFGGGVWFVARKNKKDNKLSIGGALKKIGPDLHLLGPGVVGQSLSTASRGNCDAKSMLRAVVPYLQEWSGTVSLNQAIISMA